MTSVGTALPREMLRVRDLIDAYRALPDGALAAASMRSDLERAIAAWESADVTRIVRAYQELARWA